MRLARSILCAAAGVIMMAGALTPAPSAADAHDWSGQVTLYGWGAGVTGDIMPIAGGPTLSFDKSLSEVLKDLDGAFFITGLARRGDLVLFADYTSSELSRAGRLPLGIPAAGELTVRSLTLAAGQHFDATGGTTVDVMGGLRAWDIEARISVPFVSIAPDVDFVDPIVGLRVNTRLSDDWSLLGYFDIGGFGVGSDLTWQFAATANYQATDNLYLSLGWRHLYVDLSEKGADFEVNLTGPVVGATWRF